MGDERVMGETTSEATSCRRIDASRFALGRSHFVLHPYLKAILFDSTYY